MLPLRTLVCLHLALALFASSARGETVEQAMADAYRGNPTLAGARAQLRGTDEQVAVALAARRPTVRADFSYGKLHAIQWQFLVSFLPVYRNNFHYLTRTAQFSVTQPLFRGGALTAGIRVAEAQVAVQQSQLMASEQNVLNSTGIACADLIQAAGALKLAEAYATDLARQRDGVAMLAQRQDMTVTDKAQAETRLASARAQVSQARAQFFAARSSFQALVGRPPEGIPAPILLNIPVGSEAEALQLALAENPTILVARHAIPAAEAGIDVAFGNWLPSVDLVGSISYASQANAGTIQERDRDAKLQISVPLFSGGAHLAQSRQARHLVEQRRYDLEDSEAAVTAAVHQSWQGVQVAEAVLSARQRQFESANRSIAGVQLQFERGNRSFLDTLNALQEAMTTRTNLLAAERGVTLAKLQLLAVLGALTAEKLKLPVALHDPGEHLRATYRSWLDIGE